MNSYLSRYNLETDNFKERACRPKHFQWRQQDVYCSVSVMLTCYLVRKNLEEYIFFADGLPCSLMEFMNSFIRCE